MNVNTLRKVNKIDRITEKAYHVLTASSTRGGWLPKSQIKMHIGRVIETNERFIIAEMPTWLAEKNNGMWPRRIFQNPQPPTLDELHATGKLEILVVDMEL